MSVRANTNVSMSARSRAKFESHIMERNSRVLVIGFGLRLRLRTRLHLQLGLSFSSSTAAALNSWAKVTVLELGFPNSQTCPFHASRSFKCRRISHLQLPNCLRSVDLICILNMLISYHGLRRSKIGVWRVESAGEGGLVCAFRYIIGLQAQTRHTIPGREFTNCNGAPI